jgi:hypothetical protein
MHVPSALIRNVSRRVLSPARSLTHCVLAARREGA